MLWYPLKIITQGTNVQNPQSDRIDERLSFRPKTESVYRYRDPASIMPVYYCKKECFTGRCGKRSRRAFNLTPALRALNSSRFRITFIAFTRETLLPDNTPSASSLSLPRRIAALSRRPGTSCGPVPSCPRSASRVCRADHRAASGTCLPRFGEFHPLP